MDLLAIALAPGIAIILFILYHDKLDREPAVVLLVSFLLGMLTTLPAIALENTVDYFSFSGIQGSVVTAFLGVALVEEFVKFIPLRLYAFTRKSFDEPLDGIVHGVMIGMGFATVENILYVYQHGMETGWLRMFTAVPGHASWGVIVGYYTGKAKFLQTGRLSVFMTGFVLATFFHGLYDACLFITKHVDKNTAFILAMAAMTTHVLAVLLAARLIKTHHQTSQKLYKHLPVLTIRYADRSDIPLIRTLALQIWPGTYKRILSKEQIRYMLQLIYSEQALKNQIGQGHQFIIVYNNAIPVGFASFSQVETSVYKLQKIYLLSNQQGRGTGKFTIQQVIADIQPKGATALQLNVNRYNTARSFYEKMGFKIIGEENTDIGDGHFMDDYIMELNVIDFKQKNGLGVG